MFSFIIWIQGFQNILARFFFQEKALLSALFVHLSDVSHTREVQQITLVDGSLDRPLPNDNQHLSLDETKYVSTVEKKMC